jgi:hypothetical protein
MPVLFEIQGPESGTTFVSDSVFEFVSDSVFVFEDSDDVLRISTEKVADAHYWSPDILDMEPFSWRCDTVHGGMVRTQDRSSVTITMKAFVDKGWWLPDTIYTGTIYYTPDTEANAIPIVNCTLYRNKIDPPLSVSFDIYPEAYVVNLLSEATDYNGDTVPLPMAFGNVSYVIPVRLPDAGGGNRRYSSCGMTGTKHTHWHVFDDGVDACSNATTISSGVFEYTVTPAGEITVSGCGNATDTDPIYGTKVCYFNQLLAVLCGSGYLNIPLTTDFTFDNQFFEVNTFITSQDDVISFISKLASTVDSLCYIHNGTLYAHNFTWGSTQLTDINVETDLISIDYTKRGPVKKIIHTWIKRESVSESIGQYVKETEQEKSYVWDYPIGTEETINLYEESGYYNATWKLNNILAYLNKMEFTATKPLVGELILPGNYMDIYDYRYTGATFKASDATITDLVYDFIGKKITMEGYISSLVEL